MLDLNDGELGALTAELVRGKFEGSTGSQGSLYKIPQEPLSQVVHPDEVEMSCRGIEGIEEL